MLKALAEYHDFTLGDLPEGIVLHAFEGKPPFGAVSIKKIAQLKQVYGLQLTSADAHRLREGEPLLRPGAARGRSRGRRSASG